jgi:hypothetical protein
MANKGQQTRRVCLPISKIPSDRDSFRDDFQEQEKFTDPPASQNPSQSFGKGK